MPQVAVKTLREPRNFIASLDNVASLPLILALALSGAVFTGLAAQARMGFVGTPIPLTGQVFAVLVCGALLGRWAAGLSQVFYIALAFLGIGWLADTTTGMAIFKLMTVGYIFGFAFAAAFLGLTARRSEWTRSFNGQFMLMAIAVAIIHACGIIGICLTRGFSPATAMIMGSFPFVIMDLIKIMGAATLTSFCLRK
jgi:biotin transport system substrate-specific component